MRRIDDTLPGNCGVRILPRHYYYYIEGCKSHLKGSNFVYKSKASNLSSKGGQIGLMEFKVDRHGQLRILATEDFKVNPSKPDLLILTVEETERLRNLLKAVPVNL